MTEQIETLKQIVADAPEGWTHIEQLASTKQYYMKKLKNGRGYQTWLNSEWVCIAVSGNVRSRKDIETIIAQHEMIAELEKQLKDASDFLARLNLAYLAISQKLDKKLALAKVDI